MKKYIAVAVLLTAALVLLVRPVSGTGNTYAVTRSVTYNQAVGTNGTVYVTYHFTGTTQQPPNMCTTQGVQHQPRVGASMLVNGTQTAYSSAQGQYVGPCTSMSQNLTVAFDLASVGCDLGVLDNGGCEVDDQPIIFCTALAGAFGAIPTMKIQIELADTTSQVDWNTKGTNSDGVDFYDAHQVCPAGLPTDIPPDFPGPDIVYNGKDPIQTGYVRTQDFCSRLTPVGTSFAGVPWSCVNVPRNGYFGYVQMASTLFIARCTNKDNGSNPSF